MRAKVWYFPRYYTEICPSPKKSERTFYTVELIFVLISRV